MSRQRTFAAKDGVASMRITKERGDPDAWLQRGIQVERHSRRVPHDEDTGRMPIHSVAVTANKEQKKAGEEEVMTAMADKEYIERDAAIKAILSNPPDAHYPSWYAADVENVPTADVEEVRHGEWVPQSQTKGSVQAEAVCSNCGRDVVYQIVNGKWEFENFCPRCGARMDGKGDA